MLFHLDTESSPIVLGQSASLLSFWSVTSNAASCGPNTLWLKTAIHFAQAANADSTCSALDFKLPSECFKEEENTLMRLWWCCIIRDRSISLGQNRRLLIAQQYPVPSHRELEDEIIWSRLRSSHSKSILTGHLIQLMKLCMALTDVLEICLPADSYMKQLHTDSAATMSKISACELLLQA